MVITHKKFLPYRSVEHTKRTMNHKQHTLFETAIESRRLHDVFIKITEMTPSEFENGGENLSINYSFNESPFGKLLIASTPKGICYMVFVDNETYALNNLKQQFPKATLEFKSEFTHQSAVSIFKDDWSETFEIELHLKGTDFQLKVWRALLKIPFGKLSTYGNIAKQIGRPNASRAVGTAIGNNPISFLIPCHRVIQSNGNIGGYMWGNTRKKAIIGWESTKSEYK